jgi:hypothetical protein
MCVKLRPVDSKVKTNRRRIPSVLMDLMESDPNPMLAGLSERYPEFAINAI